jgi:hypothetical protein
MALAPPGVEGTRRGGGTLQTLLFPGVEGAYRSSVGGTLRPFGFSATRSCLPGITGGRPSFAAPVEPEDLISDVFFGFGATVLLTSLWPASELAYLLPRFPKTLLNGLKRLLAMLPASLPTGVDGAEVVPGMFFFMAAVVEMTAADLVLVGRGGIFLLTFSFLDVFLKGLLERDLERDRDRRAFSRLREDRLLDSLDFELVSLLEEFVCSFFGSFTWATLSSSGIRESSFSSPSTS